MAVRLLVAISRADAPAQVNVLYDEGAVLISSHPTIQEAYLSGEVVYVVLVQRDGASATVAAVPPPAPTVRPPSPSFSLLHSVQVVR